MSSPQSEPKDDRTTSTTSHLPNERAVERALRSALREVLHGSLPREVGIKVKEIRPGRGRPELVYARAELVVHKESLKAIIIGREGGTIREIGKRARELLENRVGKPFYLDLAVVVDPKKSPTNRWFKVRDPSEAWLCPAFKHPHLVSVRESRIRGNARVAAFVELEHVTVHGGVMISNFSSARRSVLHKRVSVSSHCEIERSELGPVTFVGDGAEIHGCKIEERCFVGMNAYLSRCEIGRWSVIGAGAHISDLRVPERSLVIDDGIVDRLDVYTLVVGKRLKLELNGSEIWSGQGETYYVCYLHEDNRITVRPIPTGRVLCEVRKTNDRWEVRGKGFVRTVRGSSLHWYVGHEMGLLG
ncbi:KH domain-containing protein [Methanopyrus sp. SNP6]|uniref:KH domain-containing protein n=1 Tax=Methanopyrus sp. SNP6 TaxID=1937005 RepID=UPI00143B89FD|nr:KH domain-containing protein [Methanopyrus sp. SNP6]